MNNKTSLAIASQVSISKLQNSLLVSLQGDLSDNDLEKVRQDLLAKIHSTSTTTIIIDLNAIRVLDVRAFSHLRDTARIAKLIGAETAMTGFQPGIVSFLVDMNIETNELKTFRTIEDGLAYFKCNQ